MGSGTGIGRVRGLGSAGHGSHHWIMQRVTAVSNLILMLWFMATLTQMPSFDYETVALWLSSPIVAVAMILLLVSTFWHFRLGLQVMVEDYVHDDGLKFACILALNFYAVGGVAFGAFCIVKIAFTRAPA